MFHHQYNFVCNGMSKAPLNNMWKLQSLTLIFVQIPEGNIAAEVMDEFMSAEGVFVFVNMHSKDKIKLTIYIALQGQLSSILILIYFN